jgi:hypothetical protein
MFNAHRVRRRHCVLLRHQRSAVTTSDPCAGVGGGGLAGYEHGGLRRSGACCGGLLLSGSGHGRRSRCGGGRADHGAARPVLEALAACGLGASGAKWLDDMAALLVVVEALRARLLHDHDLLYTGGDGDGAFDCGSGMRKEEVGRFGCSRLLIQSRPRGNRTLVRGNPACVRGNEEESAQEGEVGKRTRYPNPASENGGIVRRGGGCPPYKLVSSYMF